MARRNAAIADEIEAQEESGPVTETLTYVPGNGDPAATKWGGHTFHANVPKELTGHPDGNERERLNHHIITSARNNPCFSVGGEKPAARPGAKKPKTAEEYRAFFAKWLLDPAIEHVDQLIARFARDRELQAACEVGTADFALIGELFMPRLHELAKADEMSHEQVAATWINHGYNQLPW